MTRPYNWIEMTQDERDQWQKAKTEREDLEYATSQERRRAEDAESATAKARRNYLNQRREDNAMHAEEMTILSEALHQLKIRNAELEIMIANFNMIFNYTINTIIPAIENTNARFAHRANIEKMKGLR